MKCEKCENQATFHFQSNVNGEKTEYHLCNDCAKEAGFGETLSRAFTPAYSSFFSNPYSMMAGFFDGMPMGSMFGRSPMATALAHPWVNVFIGDGENTTSPKEKEADNIPEDAGDEIKAKRELCALRHQLKQAIKAEEFEKAAELRDKIRDMEQ